MDTLLACGDPACRSAALHEAWETDAGRVEGWLVALPPAEGRDLLVEQLALAEPSEARRICSLLPKASQEASRCSARVVRPHLGPGTEHKRGNEQVAAGSAAGPRSTTLRVPALPPPAWESATEEEYGAVLERCEQPEPALCGRFAARARAADGDLAGVGLACVAADPARGKDYSECLFQSAEALTQAQGAEGFGDALTLCTASSFSPMCAAHILTLLGPRVPAADEVTEEDLAGARAAVAAIRAATDGYPRIQASYIDWYWATWTGTTWRWAEHVDGRLAPLLPPEAQPHVAVAVAARLLRERDIRRLRFELFLADLRAALSDPGAPPTGGPTSARHRLITQHARSAWPEDRDSQRGLTAAWVLGPGRRAVAVDDPEADLRIAALEAIAQLPKPPPVSLFLEQAADQEQHVLVRWTAARLGAFLDTEAAGGLSDPDPLVQDALRSQPMRPKPKPKP